MSEEETLLILVIFIEMMLEVFPSNARIVKEVIKVKEIIIIKEVIIVTEVKK